MIGNEVKRLVLVEDDRKLSGLVSQFLSENSFAVTVYNNAETFFAECDFTQVDVIVCDINLPRTSGFDLCRIVRDNFNGPFIFLTARSDDEDQITGFEIGADAYILKPIRPQVLLAKINALIRINDRNPGAQMELHRIELDQLLIDFNARVLKVCNNLVRLSTEEFELMWLMVKHREKVLNREELFEMSVGREYDGLDRTVDGRISRIRKKFNPIQNNPYEIKTIWRKGYLFATKEI